LLWGILTHYFKGDGCLVIFEHLEDSSLYFLRTDSMPPDATLR